MRLLRVIDWARNSAIHVKILATVEAQLEPMGWPLI